MIIKEYKLRKIIRRIISEAGPGVDRNKFNAKKLGRALDPKTDAIAEMDDSEFVEDLMSREYSRKGVPSHWMNWHTGSGTGMIGNPVNLKQEMIMLSAINLAKEYCKTNHISDGSMLKHVDDVTTWEHFDPKRETTPLKLNKTKSASKNARSYEALLEDAGFYKCEIRVRGYAFSDIYSGTKLDTFKEDYYRRYYKRMLKQDYDENLFDKQTFYYNGYPYADYTSGKLGTPFKSEPTYEKAFPNRSDKSWAREPHYGFDRKDFRIPTEQEEYIRKINADEFGEYDIDKDDQQIPVKGSGIADQKPYEMPDPTKAKREEIDAANKEREEIAAQRKEDLKDKRKYTQHPAYDTKTAKLKGHQVRFSDVRQPSLYIVHFYLNPNYQNDEGEYEGPKTAFPKIKLYTKDDLAADVPPDLHSVEIKNYRGHHFKNREYEEDAISYSKRHIPTTERGRRMKHVQDKLKKKKNK
tara:strand:- start:48 stop:1448 length:1401 start_codon:yes stop_codon:yes gene_type:complete